jgi:hypothetical protein
MSDRRVEVEAALDRLVAAARAHLDAVSAAAGAPDDDGVWRAYVGLNNAAHDYDRMLGAAFDEVTPFDVEKIVDDADGVMFASTAVEFPPPPGDDRHPRVVSVRQRRDYRVPSVAALLRVAREGRPAASSPSDEPVTTVGAAIIELLESGDGSMGMLDLPELEPLDGVVLVAEVDTPLRPDVLDTVDEATADQPFRLAPGETVAARLHESAPTEAE